MTMWVCDWCHRINNQTDTTCARCGRDLEEHPHGR